MLTEIGHVEAIVGYAVKPMAGEQLESAEPGWHGLEVTDAWHSAGSTTAAECRGKPQASFAQDILVRLS